MKIRYQAFLLLLAAILISRLAPAQAPVFAITPVTSKITFHVKASVPIEGKFAKWNATLVFTSPELNSGALNVTIQAASVNTGSSMKDGKLKSKDFFNVDEDPLITFKSTKVTQSGPDTFDVQGTFTIRGVSKQETLTLTTTGQGTGSGTIAGVMAFDRKDYGMDSGIPFIKIADRVEVSIDLKVKRISGPPVALKQ